MGLALSFEKNVLRLKLKDLGLNDNQIEEAMSAMDRKNKHIDVVSFAMLIERFGVQREKLYYFLKANGVEDPTLITVFSRVDLKKAGLDEDKVQEVVLVE